MSVEPAGPQNDTIEDFDSPLVRELPRDRAARLIANHLMVTFRWVIVVLPCLIFGVLIMGMYRYGITELAVLSKDVMVPLLTAASAFAATVFGSLLAFGLGYYFGKK